MEGAAIAEKRAFDRAVATAWHTEAFARTKRMKKLTDYLGSEKSSPKSQHAQAIAFFHRLKAQGVPVTITRH